MLRFLEGEHLRLAFYVGRMLGCNYFSGQVSKFWNFYRNVNMHEFQRLEFLGDKVIALHFVDMMLFDLNLNEGDLSKRMAYLGSSEFLGLVTSQIFSLPKVERSKFNADILEVAAGILYRYHRASLSKFLKPIFNLYRYTYDEVKFNPRGYLQEYLIQRKVTPAYMILREHKGWYTVGVYFYLYGSRYILIASEGSIRKAQQAAAYKAIQSIFNSRLIPSVSYSCHVGEGYRYLGVGCRVEPGAGFNQPWPYLSEGGKFITSNLITVSKLVGKGIILP